MLEKNEKIENMEKNESNIIIYNTIDGKKYEGAAQLFREGCNCTPFDFSY